MPVRTNQLEAVKAVQRRTGRTFHLATRLLPDRARDPTYALYAFFRVADEIVDDPDPESAAAQRSELQTLREQALGHRESSSEVMAAFATVRDEHDLNAEEIEIFLDAMARDLDQTRYETTDELGEYLRGSSVAVANLLIDIYAPELEPQARPHAAALAEAFQLTNFLRDVRQDMLEYGRIYLPQETLERHGISFSTIESLSFDERVAAAIADELERTEALYREGVAGIKYLPEDVQFGVLLASVLYAEHHRVIRRRGFDVISQRASLSTAERLAVVVRTWVYWQLNPEPSSVFEAVSAVHDEGSSRGSTRSIRPTLNPFQPARRAASGLLTFFGAGSK